MERPVDPEEQGVAIALEKICSLESRLRQAIQSTHTLHRSFGQDIGAVDREREALLLIRYDDCFGLLDRVHMDWVWHFVNANGQSM